MTRLGVGLRPTIRRLRPAGSPVGRPACAPVGLILLIVAMVGVAGCDRDQAPAGPPEDPRRPTIQLASFDFPESEILGQLYGLALRQHGFPVEQVVQLGAREVVAPALEQGKVDMVPEYVGSALNFLNDRDRVATADPSLTHARLEQAFAPRGISVLAFAPAQDRNGFVVSGDLARSEGLERISDLGPMASRMTLGGPPECPQRPLCLKGLQDLYKLHFARFEAMPSRAVTAAALKTGEIDVGMIDTTDPSLVRRGADLVQLADDRNLQPADNVVPVLRREVVDAYGPPLVRLVNAVSARLTTAELTRLNLQVAEGQPAADAATGWLRAHTIIG
jgi:osmoprotectant transport system substrate-binding protein